MKKNKDFDIATTKKDVKRFYSNLNNRKYSDKWIEDHLSYITKDSLELTERNHKRIKNKLYKELSKVALMWAKNPSNIISSLGEESLKNLIQSSILFLDSGISLSNDVPTPKNSASNKLKTT